jgi:hypothetical protein
MCFREMIRVFEKSVPGIGIYRVGRTAETLNAATLYTDS